MSGYPPVTGLDPAQIPALADLLQTLRARYHDAIAAVLLHGSCLRSGDAFDGVLDLYLICDSYRTAYRHWPLQLANWLLPPNVFYLELRQQQRLLRSKVTLISLRDFRRGCSRRWFHSYIWGRFAQPTQLLFCRNEPLRQTLEQALLEAARTLLQRALPALPASGSVPQLWTQALQLSYRSELRSEKPGRAAELVARDATFYGSVTRQQAAALGVPLILDRAATPTRYYCRLPNYRRRYSRALWAVRRGQGKLLSLLRLVKALFTFAGGLDYLAWKLERHSGQPVVIPERVRRRPLLFLWGFCWQLYRRGVFR